MEDFPGFKNYFLSGKFSESSLGENLKNQQLTVRNLMPPCWFQTYNFIPYANTITFFYLFFMCT
jgi:hypothetical protein